jgi:thiamine-phosphate pyrophosphorylase
MTRCLVTDRRRLCPHDRSFAAARRCLVEQAQRASADAVELIQIRERDLEAADLAAVVADLVAVTRGSATRVIVNDRLDVALACGADGVHLRADSVPVAAARALAASLPRPFLVGRSVHTVAEARAASGADYLIAGTVFPSASKPSAFALLGVQGLKAIVEATTVPVLAIGGITPDRIKEVVLAGAAGIAAIGLFIDSLKPASLT